MSTIIIGAGLGALIRWNLGISPVGILGINAFGSFVAGFLVKSPALLHPALSLGLIVGFCGALTTFSGFAVVNVRWLEQGEFFKTLVFVLLNNATCLSLCYLGWILAKRFS